MNKKYISSTEYTDIKRKERNEYMRVYMSKYNTVEYKEKRKKYREKNKEKLSDQNKEWSKNNREHVSEYNKKHNTTELNHYRYLKDKQRLEKYEIPYSVVKEYGVKILKDNQDLLKSLQIIYKINNYCEE